MHDPLIRCVMSLIDGNESGGPIDSKQKAMQSYLALQIGVARVEGVP